MSGKIIIMPFENETSSIPKKRNKKEISDTIRETDKYQMNSINKMNDSGKDKDSKKEEYDENKNLITNKKLIKIFNNINKNISNNIDKNIEEIYDIYQNKVINKKRININLNKYCLGIMSIVAPIFLIINLMAIYTTKNILESLYQIFVNSIQYFLYKKSDLELYELTDFENRFNSSYNFYNQYYIDISNNEVDYDLMMFWDFVGSFFYECMDFTGTSILFFLLNVILLVLIGGFNFLDIDEKSHKYTSFHMLYITLVYLFLWISVSASALLSIQAYTNFFQIFKKQMEEEIEENNQNNTINQEIENRIHQYDNNSNNEDNSSNDSRNISEGRIITSTLFYVIYTTSFLAFFINYPINRAIIKYRKKYISKELENIYISREEAYKNIYSKDRKLFLLTAFIPYCGEMIISLIIYGIFNRIVFTKNVNFPNVNINEEDIKMYNEKDSEIKIKEVSFKKILGYTIFSQTIIEKEKKLTKCDKCCECFGLLCKSIGECFKSSFCFICMQFCPKCTYCYECECDCCKNDSSLYKCCKGCCSCCFINSNFEQREMEICICYQEKRKLKWFKDFISNKKQIFLVQIVFLIAYFRIFIIGNEVLYKEKNQKDENQENIILPLIASFSLFIGLNALSEIVFKRSFRNKSFKFFKFEIPEIYMGLSISILLDSIISFTINGFISFCTSIVYFQNPKLFDKNNYVYLTVFINKFIIFVLTYFCQEEDGENELISNSSLIAVYLYILELFSTLIKTIFSVKVLIIFQIIFSAPIAPFFSYLIYLLFYNTYSKCKKNNS